MLLALCLAFASAPALAQEPPDVDLAHPAGDEAPPAETPPAIELDARLYVRWARRLDPAPDHPSGDLSLARARLQVTWEPSERVEGQLGADFAELIPKILDAYVAVDAAPFLKLRAGNRKVPFSGGRILSLGDLRPVRRGEYVGLVSEYDPTNLTTDSLGYAGRKIGLDALFAFRRLARLHLDVGVSQGGRGAADPAARATVRIVRGLHLAAAFTALRTPDPSVGHDYFAPAVEADALYDRRRWHAEIEVATGENWREDRAPFRGGYVLVAYEIPLGGRGAFSIEPILRGEAVDQSLRTDCNETYGATAGATLHAFDVVRLQANVEHLDRANSGACAADADDPDETRVFVQVAFDT